MGTRPDRGLGDGPQRVSDEELKDVFLRGEGEVRGAGACPSGRLELQDSEDGGWSAWST